MSQVVAFNDNVTEIAATQRPMSIAATRPPDRSADLAATENQAKEIKTAAPGVNTANSRWPRWPNAWPDGSRQL